MSYTRLRNKILQVFYRPPNRNNGIFSLQTVSVFSELDDIIERKITPLLSDFFK